MAVLVQNNSRFPLPVPPLYSGAAGAILMPGVGKVLQDTQANVAAAYNALFGGATFVPSDLTFSIVPDSQKGAASPGAGQTQPTSTGITAHSGGGQANAFQLTALVNAVTTAAAGDSVALPPAAQGLIIVVINTTTNPIQVFGAGTDTINGVATATGVTQAPNSIDFYVCNASGPAGSWFVEAGAGFAGSLLTELASNNLTATGSNQGNALQLTGSVNRLTTVAAGTGVLLPLAQQGLDIWVVNHGANPLQVYGAGTDTIDDVPTATGVTVMAGSMVIFTCVGPSAPGGAWYSNGLGTGYAGSLETQSFTDNLTAAGSSQGTALALTTMINRCTTVAASTGVLLPGGNPAAPGLSITVANAGANALTVYPQGTDQINGASSFSVAAGKTASFTSYTGGKWHAILSA